MLSYYINKGFKLDYLLNLTYNERAFFISSMAYEIENNREEQIALNPFFVKKE
ncbi:hypothetical protein [Clostridium butyricum]|uniref:hypothetical protein n=1 Tax=Clostridium butyricum TaxID=1492 RepID=UPI000B224E99|nr:hypothetical protein [Clostridium butyricum]